ncbi:50S ribosomal protein L7/L12-serine acetyltransferase [Kosakonia sp. SMBL-WEM22]|uniref:50S ribosomal protein L7/L12-serine acetyltransferase n=1 Tax=Kosakonia sp. SMBL-WEM22 TaxID=2725560 RepID=UPI001659CE35|nr:50S ribosomal protein L7/L12-serine acetyltransferase [Kosakonia sp. SMBL-WEM22]MDV5356724.1 50S ribosomal protein L7/L12-serine acetyltransferase [Enterobacter asburiae]QNQ20410.1 50S ribosomal protein L7/L12-serine acetyltransferase [Kosakonia sp. SMBL-WEM22]
MLEEPTCPDAVITVDEQLTLEMIDECFVHELHQLIVKNRDSLQRYLDWPQYVTSIETTRKTAQSNRLLHQRGYAKMFLILRDHVLVGVLSLNAIEPTNKAAYIGYWLDEAAQGQGILSRAMQAMMRFYAERGDIRRFVIKCRVDNEASNRVAERNGFTLEGCQREAEFLNGRFDDQNIWGKIVTLNDE